MEPSLAPDVGAPSTDRGASRTTAFCTGALFAIAALLPNDVIAFVSWLTALALGLPLSVTQYRRRRGLTTLRLLKPTACTLLLRLFAAASLLLGACALGWLAYGFVRRSLPWASPLQLFWQSIFPGAALVLGYRLMRVASPFAHAHGEAA